MALAIVEGVMLEQIEPEGAAKLTIDAREQIEIEFCGDAGGVVIGSVEYLDRFDQVDANDEL